MRLRTSRLFLLPIFFAAVPALPPAFAQSPSDASLEALNARVIELYRADRNLGRNSAPASRGASAPLQSRKRCIPGRRGCPRRCLDRRIRTGEWPSGEL